VIGIRGPLFQWGRQQRYGVMAEGAQQARSGERISVTWSFFFELLTQCERELDHVEREGSTSHVEQQQFPDWVKDAFGSVDFGRKMGKDAAVRVCAALLGISPATVYSQLPGKK